ncbi:hypothetical protein MOX02_46690 [Methylobacterium oxalidis]|uniref:Lipoprotein n=1 Tax=Methylobacterium oxalidis TaxID=944322 RepID=A0A512J9H9_9HYPH|nr:hypothetical protein MOX02_46690 [Methylobacterium oxalidis]GLS66245.1 hypothetical protein GCM10007888_46270 [Methylobacterium oxalidis]
MRTAALLIAFSAVIGTVQAAPPGHRQPTPESLGAAGAPVSPPAANAPGQPADKAARETAETTKRNEAARTAQDKRWDAHTKRAMGGICRGC